MCRTLSLSLFLALAVLAVAGAAAARSRAHPAVLLSGDSLAVGTGWYLPSDWQAPVRIDATVGRPLAIGLDHLRASALPPLVAVSLGTNNDPRVTQAFAAGIRTVVRLAGPHRCIVWATIVRPPVHGVSYADFNRLLRAEAAHNPLFRLVDWAAIVEAHLGVLQADGVHASYEGYRLRAQATARALDACAAQLARDSWVVVSG